MSARSIALAIMASVSLAGAAACGAPAAATKSTADTGAASTSSRTPWGDPDLQGIWSDGYTMTPVERPDQYAGREFLTDAEVVALEKAAVANPGRDARAEVGSNADVEGAYNDVFSGRGTKVAWNKRTSLIVDPPDGKVSLTPEGQKRTALEVANSKAFKDLADGPEDRPHDRCIGIALPFIRGTSGTYSRIMQTPGSIAIYYEDGHWGGGYRLVSLDGHPHLPAGIRQWFGDSRGHWEGATLVVDTTNFATETLLSGAREDKQRILAALTADWHLTERFTRVANDKLRYEVTIDDPKTLTKPVKLEVPLTQPSGKENAIFEAACHEGNYAMTSILAGARTLEKKAVAKRASK